MSMPESASPSRSPTRKLVASLAVAGAIFTQSAGGTVPDDPSLFTLSILLLGTAVGFLAFTGRRTVLTDFLLLSMLPIAAMQVWGGPRHWTVANIWIFDVLALLFLVAAIGAAAQSHTDLIARRRFRLHGLRIFGSALVLFAILFDPTEVGQNRQTFMREQIRRFVGDPLAVRVAYFVNGYTFVGALLFLVSYRFRNRHDTTDSSSPTGGSDSGTGTG